MKAVKAELQKSNPERVEAFEKGAQAFAKKVVGNFKDWEFYTGESMNPEGMVALLNYREDGTTRKLFMKSRIACTDYDSCSLPHILEARSQASQVVKHHFTCILFTFFFLLDYFGGVGQQCASQM